jgi:hypothetical protein
MLGSASIKLFIEDAGKRVTIAFSGDLGSRGVPMLKDAEGFSTANAVVLESTYGDRDHKSFAGTVAEFERIVKESIERRGKILIPTLCDRSCATHRSPARADVSERQRWRRFPSTSTARWPSRHPSSLVGIPSCTTTNSAR